MATTAIWDVKGWVGDVLVYAKNPEKTVNPAWSETERAGMLDVMETAMQDAQERGLLNVLEYAAADFKTEQRYFVSGVNCLPDVARQQMVMAKKQWSKEGGIVAYHGYQSFKPGEVTPEQAHSIGIELANRLWGDRFQVVVATHLNTRCIHNHFVVNSVSFIDGYRYYDNKASYALMRRTSDELCKEHTLSVIQQPQYRKKHYAEWDAEQKGQPTWRSAIRVDVDSAVKASMTWSAFLRNLQEAGYEIKTGVKHIAIRPRGKERFVRLRSLGEQYTEDAIRQRILRQRVPERPPRPEPQKVVRVRMYGDFHLSKVTWKGLRALYFYYLYRLRRARRQPQARIPYALRDDLRRLNALSEQAKLLHRYKIDTVEQLADTGESIEARIVQLCAERQTLNNEKRRTGTSVERAAEIAERVTEIGAQLKPLRRERWLCGQVKERSVILQKNQEQMKQQEKEADAHVPIRGSSRTNREHGDQRDGQRR